MKPPPLQPGDMIGVFAPSGYIERENIEQAAAVLESAGYRIFIHPQTFMRHQQSAGTPEDKAKALHELFANPDIRAVIAAGGGNRCLHFLDRIDFDLIKARPKCLMGFSDATALINAVYARTGLETIHGPVFSMLKNFSLMNDLLALLSGRGFTLPLEQARIIRPGTATGRLAGGNLSIVQYLPGTPYMPDPAGAILFLEDCNDETSRIDRMFLHLRRTGLLEKIAGLVLGEFTNLKDTGKRPFGFSLEDIVREHTSGLDIPVVINAPFGHGGMLYPLPVGSKARLIASGDKAALTPAD